MISRTDIQVPFLYIRIPKTASTSLCEAFRDYADQNDQIINSISGVHLLNKPKKGVSKHIRYCDAAAIYDLSSRYVWAFIRRPDNRLRSAFYSYQAITKRKKRPSLNTKDINEWILALYELDHSKNELTNTQEKYSYSLLMPEICYLTDDGTENGKICVDFIGYFKNLRKDYDRLCKELRIPAKKYLPQLKKSRKNNIVCTKYNKECKDLIWSTFQKDFETFYPEIDDFE